MAAVLFRRTPVPKPHAAEADLDACRNLTIHVARAASQPSSTRTFRPRPWASHNAARDWTALSTPGPASAFNAARASCASPLDSRRSVQSRACQRGTALSNLAGSRSRAKSSSSNPSATGSLGQFGGQRPGHHDVPPPERPIELGLPHLPELSRTHVPTQRRVRSSAGTAKPAESAADSSRYTGGPPRTGGEFRRTDWLALSERGALAILRSACSSRLDAHRVPVTPGNKPFCRGAALLTRAPAARPTRASREP